MKHTRRAPRPATAHFSGPRLSVPLMGLLLDSPTCGERGAGQLASLSSLLGSQGAPAGRAVASGEVSFWPWRASIRDHDQDRVSERQVDTKS